MHRAMWQHMAFIWTWVAQYWLVHGEKMVRRRNTATAHAMEAMGCVDGAPLLCREMLKWEEIAPDQLLLLSKEDECRSIAG